ncbi:acyltransferase family protein [Cytophaga hutchinsonii]|uniref:acyltransferase family protein n=1 Tax=Cytophaga hutchinsonii TaxID=985 RepID=UPI0015A619E8|nr:acyltransferase [Cytophaga hutchinsonii]
MKQPAADNKFYFLELMRTLAALYVVGVHIHQIVDFGKIGSMLFAFGQEAVMIFFVLSGFVIYYSAENKKTLTIPQYFKARFLRIYPVFILACLLTYVAKSFISDEWLDFQWISFLENICMLQDFSTGKPGVWIQPFMGNTPLWSLSYEWWFYMLFIPIYFYIPENRRYLYVGIISSAALVVYLIFPNQICLWLSYFILWWLGAEVSRKHMQPDSVNLNTLKKTLFITAALLVLLLVYLLYWKTDHTILFGLFPVLFIRHFVASMIFVTVLWNISKNTFNIGSANLLVRLAPYTYAIYVFHYPVLLMFEKTGWIFSIWGMAASLVAMLLLAIIAEEVFQKNIVRWFKKI